MPTITCVEDFRQLYRRRVPKMFYDYCESGSYTESTFRRNEEDFGKVQIRQRVGKDISNVRTSTTMAGANAAIPAAFAPVGMLGIQHAAGEIKAATSARDFGVPFILSTMSICSIEQVADATGAPFWFQLYVVKDREFVSGLIQRAKPAGCNALVVTMDLSVLGQRHKGVKNQLSIRPNLRNILSLASKPRWAMQMAATPYKSFGNVIGHAKGVEDFIVSNHGGRQLDGAGSTISTLPRIADAVGDQMELLMDSGVRTGMDIFRARALGASGVLLGRPMVYALGAMGQEGTSQLLEILQKELKTTMALAGLTDVDSINGDSVYTMG